VKNEEPACCCECGGEIEEGSICGPCEKGEAEYSYHEHADCWGDE
jgi:hypothetical protein